LDKASCEAVQKNLTTDFLRIALIHREEVTKLLASQEDLIPQMRQEMETVAEPVGPSTQPMEAVAAAEEDDEETADDQEPSIIHVLNED
jgi:hypothetical protein